MITLKKAIKTLEEEVVRSLIHYDKNSVDAIRLGIEALKREKEYRLTRGNRTFDLLPGETEE